MRYAIYGYRNYAGIAYDNFLRGFSGRVAVIRRLDVALEHFPDMRQLRQQVDGSFLRHFMTAAGGAIFQPAAVFERFSIWEESSV